MYRLFITSAKTDIIKAKVLQYRMKGGVRLENVLMQNVGNRIREARKTRGITQAELADRLHIANSHMSDIERGQANFGVDILMRITDVLQVSADWLLFNNTPDASHVHVQEMVYNDLDYEHEADIFANQTRYTRALSSYDIFVAKIEAGYDEQLMIKSLVESYDLRISQTAHMDRNICAVSALEKIYETYGFHALDATLRLVLATWEGESASFAGNILQGVARIVVCFGDSLDCQVFAERLGHISLKEIVRSARERNNGTIGYAETMITYYNKKARGSSLPWSKLYNVPKADGSVSDHTAYNSSEENKSDSSQSHESLPSSDMEGFEKETEILRDFPEG